MRISKASRSYSSVVQQGDASSVFREEDTEQTFTHAAFHPTFSCYSSSWRLTLGDEILSFGEPYEVLRAAPFLLSFCLVQKNVSSLIWAVCSSCQANNVLCCVCLGRGLGEKQCRYKSKNSFSPILTPWVWLSRGPDASSRPQGTSPDKGQLNKCFGEHCNWIHHKHYSQCPAGRCHISSVQGGNNWSVVSNPKSIAKRQTKQTTLSFSFNTISVVLWLCWPSKMSQPNIGRDCTIRVAVWSVR